MKKQRFCFCLCAQSSDAPRTGDAMHGRCNLECFAVRFSDLGLCNYLGSSATRRFLCGSVLACSRRPMVLRHSPADPASDLAAPCSRLYHNSAQSQLDQEDARHAPIPTDSAQAQFKPPHVRPGYSGNGVRIFHRHRAGVFTNFGMLIRADSPRTCGPKQRAGSPTPPSSDVPDAQISADEPQMSA